MEECLMKKVLSVLLSICMMSLMFGCSAEPKEQSATYVLTEEEAEIINTFSL